VRLSDTEAHIAINIVMSVHVFQPVVLTNMYVSQLASVCRHPVGVTVIVTARIAATSSTAVSINDDNP
jgi:hypothetical protein